MTTKTQRRKPMPPDTYVESPQGILTVGQLIFLLEGIDPETHVVIGTDTWYDNVAGVQMPEQDGFGGVCVTLVHGEPYDTRQQ